MRKTKRRQLKSIDAGESNAKAVELIKSPKSKVEEETNVDKDSWVIVKKQKIRIFIPPLSVVVPTDHEKSRGKRIQPGARKRGRPKLQYKDDMSLLERETQCGERRKSYGSNISPVLLSPAQNEQSNVPPAIVAEVPTVSGTSDGLPSQKDVEEGSDELSGPNNVDLTSHVHRQSEDGLLESKDKNVETGTLVNDSEDVVGEPSSTLQPLPEEDESARIPQEQQDFKLLESVNYPNNCRVQDRNIRALVLEHKLELAGGVNKWLISKGLERFVDIFQKEKMGNFELLNLTMERLKDMGLNAVGPRRKLMHAIDCLTQP
ncbi:unnamed protein product [Victoria cruziana]